MSGVRLLVGTRKGAFVLTSDGTREDWKVEGPLFAGWEIYHVNGSPADADRLYIEHFVANARASELYERHGYAVDRIEPSSTGTHALDVVWRARDLA